MGLRSRSAWVGIHILAGAFFDEMQLELPKKVTMGTIALSKPLVSCIGCFLRSSLTDLGRRRITGWLLDSSPLNLPPLLSESRESSIARCFLGGGSKVCAACDEHELSG